MKPATHLVVGLSIGALIGACYHSPMPEYSLITMSALIGAGLPDVAPLAQMKADDYMQRPRFSTEREGSFWFVLKEVTHSPLIWIIALLVTLLPLSHVSIAMLQAFAYGVLSHLVIDAFTHCGEEFKDTDQSLLFPLYYLFPGLSKPGHIPKLGHMIGKTGMAWEYRSNYKADPESLGKTKLPERIVQLGVALTWLALFAMRLRS
jgi:membrane-bound metal-dependent hydrolase YbcI (DUF457 family)